MEWGPADAVTAGGVGFASQEETDNLRITAFHGKMERGSSRGIGSVHIRPSLDEDGRDFRTVAEDGLLERRHARIGSGLGESGVGSEKALDNLNVSSCDRLVDGFTNDGFRSEQRERGRQNGEHQACFHLSMPTGPAGERTWSSGSD